MDLIERLTRDRRPLDTVINAISQAQTALRSAVRAYTEPGLTDPASTDQQQLAAGLADATVIAVLGLHALGRNTAGELAAAADRIDPWGAATRFREANDSGGWRHLGTSVGGGILFFAPAGTPGPPSDQLAAAYHGGTVTATGPADAEHYHPAGVCAEPQPAPEVSPPLAGPACPECGAVGLFVHALASGWHQCDACGLSWALQ
jgi:hypothetical protein